MESYTTLPYKLEYLQWELVNYDVCMKGYNRIEELVYMHYTMSCYWKTDFSIL